MTPRASCAERINAAAPLAVQAVKAIVDATGELPVPEGYARLRDGSIAALARVEGSADAAEGPRALPRAATRSGEASGRRRPDVEEPRSRRYGVTMNEGGIRHRGSFVLTIAVAVGAAVLLAVLLVPGGSARGAGAKSRTCSTASLRCRLTTT